MSAGPERCRTQQPAAGQRSTAPAAPARHRVDEWKRLPASLGNSATEQLLGRLQGGVPLSTALRTEAEAAFSADFGAVRIHDHPAAHALADQQLARAFTVGKDVVFNAGRFRPHTAEGRRLLAHELAHVVQQGRPAGPPAAAVHEQAADQAAQAMVQGGRGPIDAGPAAARGVQREPLSDDEIAQLSLAKLYERALANEREASYAVHSDAYLERLKYESVALQTRLRALRATAASSSDSAPDPAVEALRAEVRAEMAEIDPAVVKMIADIVTRPADVVLSVAVAYEGRLAGDAAALRGAEAQAGAAAGEVRAAARRIAELQALYGPAVAGFRKWHEANSPGRSLGMINEDAGTWLAGKALAQTDKGGIGYVTGGIIYVGAFGVAMVDAAESVLAFGVHETATEVSKAYTRGDISWNEGDQIMRGAIGRALLVAVVTRGIGAAASRIGAGAATALRIAPSTARFGLVQGGVAGGLGAVGALGAQTLVTQQLEAWFSRPEARAIWNLGLVKGRDWAVTVPLAMLLGGLGGVRGVQLANDKLIGTLTATPDGPMQVVAVTRDGQLVLKPAGGGLSLPPPPPPSTISMVYDPVTGVWQSAPGGGAGTLAKTGAAPIPGELVKATPALPARVPLALPAGATGLPGPTPEVTVQAAPTPKPAAPKLLGPGKPRPRVQAADQRLTQAEQSASSARTQADQARQRLQAVEGDLQAARELKAEAGKSAAATALVIDAKAGLTDAKRALRELDASSRLADAELQEAQRAQQRIVQLESDLAALDAGIQRELNPPGGFSKEAIREGRRPGMTPLPSRRLQPSAAEYHRLNDARTTAMKELQGEVENLARSVAEQIERAVPGAQARPVALDNARQLGALSPQGAQPIDVTTGQPISGTDWATDHIMSRVEIGRDPRFLKATPLQREALLLDVPENYLPMTTEANGSKGGKTVSQWIADRKASGQALPPEMVEALRAADLRARAAIEAKFRQFGLLP